MRNQQSSHFIAFVIRQSNQITTSSSNRKPSLPPQSPSTKSSHYSCTQREGNPTQRKSQYSRIAWLSLSRQSHHSSRNPSIRGPISQCFAVATFFVQAPSTSLHPKREPATTPPQSWRRAKIWNGIRMGQMKKKKITPVMFHLSKS